MGLLSGSFAAGRYVPSRLVQWALAKAGGSGNAWNGLGERARRRAFSPIKNGERSLFRPVFFILFVRSFVKNPINWITHLRRERRGHVEVAPERVEASPAAHTRALKAFALAQAGNELVGIARMREEWVYAGHAVHEPWIVLLGQPMDYERLSRNLELDFLTAGREVNRTYLVGQTVALAVANWIRARGWHAYGMGGLTMSDKHAFSAIPAAIEAGFGELGKHGSIINDRLGSNFRMSYVLTEMPLVADAPRDIGAEDFCLRCQKCTTDCPPDAIADHKQLVRGEQRWYVDLDRCAPYLIDHWGCAICLSACPWSRPGVAERLTVKMLSRRQRKAAAAG